jgi:hypothetical protein|tara:strand:- start:469 stop:1152 length:684 start_codon:yes stop_codon:yes gene_type:complete
MKKGEYIMNLSTDTIAMLKNFSDINQNILIKPGNKIQTISNMRNILAEAEIKEKFDSEFAIYDLPQFLRSLDLFKSPELKFNGGASMTISEAKSSKSVKYFFSDKSTVFTPNKINMPDNHVTFTLKNDDLAELHKGVTTLNLPDVSVIGDGKNIKLVATDKKNKSSNEVSTVIGESDVKFTAYFKSENFKMIPDDYDVAISKAKISSFISRGKNVQYWIALEPDSEF